MVLHKDELKVFGWLLFGVLMLNTNAAKHIRYTTRVGEQTNLSKSLCISKPKTDYDKPEEQDLKKELSHLPT